MRIRVLRGKELSPDLAQAWAVLQQANPSLASPYFRPEFFQAVAAVRDDVEVAVMEESGRLVGFFPYQRGRFGSGRPVAGRLSDYHGVIGRPELTFDPIRLLRACRLRSWEFDHLVAAQTVFQPFWYATDGSPYLNLEQGWAAYEAERRASGSDFLRVKARKRRKMEREVGPLRLEFRSSDRAALSTLLAWKSGQYRRTETTDVFAFPWTVALLERLWNQPGTELTGQLSCLYVGDRLAAAEYSLRSFDVVHSWFPAYDAGLARYSPGMLLLLDLAKEIAGEGIRRLDLGKGKQEYKARLCADATPLAVGRVTLSPLEGWVRRGLREARDWFKQSPLRGPFEAAGRWTRPLRGWLAFR
jgi:CelD/BcsL family acetyltransferase involved in cellulose biosynthesis